MADKSRLVERKTCRVAQRVRGVCNNTTRRNGRAPHRITELCREHVPPGDVDALLAKNGASKKAAKPSGGAGGGGGGGVMDPANLDPDTLSRNAEALKNMDPATLKAQASRCLLSRRDHHFPRVRGRGPVALPSCPPTRAPPFVFLVRRAAAGGAVGFAVMDCVRRAVAARHHVAITTPPRLAACGRARRASRSRPPRRARLLFHCATRRQR